jgi:hypothetical protein
MNSIIRYTEHKKIDNEFKKYHLIPYRVIRETRYERKGYYYSEYWGSIFKVISVDYDNETGELQGAYIRYENGYCGMLCTELDINDYRLIKDTKSLHNTNIINSGEPYSGAEIVYWFFINKITGLNPIYRGFWKFVDINSAHRISDTANYIVTAEINPKNGCYVGCKMKRV